MRSFLVEALEKCAGAVDNTASQEELDEMVHEANKIFRTRHKHFEARVSRSFSIGDQVEFNGKHGQVLRGELIGKSGRSASVRVPTTMVAGKPFGYPQKWTVSWSFLRKVGKTDRKEVEEKLAQVVG